MKAKKFKSYTPAGFGISPSGRLMVPLGASHDNFKDGVTNIYGQPWASIGQYVLNAPHTGIINKKSPDIGIITNQIDLTGRSLFEYIKPDGTSSREWAKWLFVLTPEQYQELTHFS